MYSNLFSRIPRSGINWLCAIIVLLLSLFSIRPALADENFQSGTYRDTNGNQYLVSGAAPSLPGRAQWTIRSTVARAGTTNRFNAVWETGPAIGGTYVSGFTSIINSPAAFPTGRSYGLSSDNDFGWGRGSLISASQNGTTLLISLLRSDGSTSTSLTLTFVASGGETSGTSNTFVPGTYQDANGNQYLVSGAAPSLPGRAQWTIRSTVARAGTTNRFNAVWETGAAIGGTYVSGNTSLINSPNNFLAGRTYGASSDNDFGWGRGSLISASQVGTSLLLTLVRSDGSTSDSFMLTFAAPSCASEEGMDVFTSGEYRDALGNLYQLTGPVAVAGGRTQWTLASTTPRAGTTNTFNANWETGAVVGNSLVRSVSSVISNPGSFVSGRSYGLTSNNNFGWGTGSLMSASQVSGAILVTLVRSDGSTSDSFVLARTAPAIPSLARRGGIDLTGTCRSSVLVRSTAPELREGKLVGTQMLFSRINDPGAAFRLVGVTDFDGNGKSDLAFQNMTSPGEFGEVRSWTDFNSSIDRRIRDVKRVWDVQGVGDLDGTGGGIGDLVWRYVVSNSPDTGVSYIWFTNGTNPPVVRKRGGAPLDWKLLGAVDINEDSAADMVYVSPASQIRVLMATADRTCANLSGGTVPAGFTALKFADFTGARRGDILIRNLANGQTALLNLNATGLPLPPYTANPDDPNASCTSSTLTVTTTTLAMPVSDPSWQFYAAGDYNGDGVFDILWLRPDGSLTLWLMNTNGAAPTVIQNAGIAPAGFTVFMP